MKYLSDNKPRIKTRVFFFSGIVVLGYVLYNWSSVSAFLYARIEPLIIVYGKSKTITSGSIENIEMITKSKSELYAENKKLLLYIENLENQIAEKNAVIMERSLLDEASSTVPVATIMYPLVRDGTGIYATILFSKGAIDGVRMGQIVYVRGMQPVCVLVEVYEKTSLCSLFSRGGLTTEAVIISPVATSSHSSLAVSLVGEGGGSFSVVIPKEITVAIGDGVYLRSNPHMKLGTVVSIVENEQAIGSKLYIQGAYNPLTSSIFYVSDIYE